MCIRDSLSLYTDADFASDVKASLSTTGASLKIEGPNTSFVLSALSKKQTAVCHSSTESEIVAADTSIRTVGIPTMILIDFVLNRGVKMNFYEDNQSAIKIIESGYSQTLRHISRTHRVNLAWLKDQFTKLNIDMKYITTERQAADILTKHFVDRLKWYAALLAINHYPNFSVEWLMDGSPVNLEEPYIRDTVPYKHSTSKKHTFDDGTLEEFDILSEGEYADTKKADHTVLNRNYTVATKPPKTRKYKKNHTA